MEHRTIQEAKSVKNSEEKKDQKLIYCLKVASPKEPTILRCNHIQIISSLDLVAFYLACMKAPTPYVNWPGQGRHETIWGIGDIIGNAFRVEY